MVLFGSKVFGLRGFGVGGVFESLLLFVFESEEEFAEVTLEEFGSELEFLRGFDDEGFALFGLVEVDLIKVKVGAVGGLEIDFEDFERVVLFESTDSAAGRAKLEEVSGFGALEFFDRINRRDRIAFFFSRFLNCRSGYFSS